jgi:hypothetical protein
LSRWQSLRKITKGVGDGKDAHSVLHNVLLDSPQAKSRPVVASL